MYSLLRSYGKVCHSLIKYSPFDYIPSHLHHMVFEIMKNSMRATMENMKRLEEKEPEPINVIISHGENDITVKVIIWNSI